MDRNEFVLSEMTTQDLLVGMSEGNAGALSVIIALMKREPVEGLLVLCHLDDMNIRGTQFWVGYKYHCNQDLERFIDCVIHRDEGMVNKINEMSLEQKFEWKATRLKEKVRPKFVYQ